MNFISDGVALATEECCTCGVVFGIPQTLQRTLRKNHHEFFCPNGHPQFYFAETEAEKLTRQLQQERAAHDQTKACRRDLEKKVGELQAKEKRQAKRSRAGVCPCCQRTFSQLAHHMRCKHPEYGQE